MHRQQIIFDSLTPAQQKVFEEKASGFEPNSRWILVDQRSGKALRYRALVRPVYQGHTIGMVKTRTEPLTGDKFYGYELTEYGRNLVDYLQTKLEKEEA